VRARNRVASYRDKSRFLVQSSTRRSWTHPTTCDAYRIPIAMTSTPASRLARYPGDRLSLD
jgi:hypothetical protein